jgi:hypothetical protein
MGIPAPKKKSGRAEQGRSGFSNSERGFKGKPLKRTGKSDDATFEELD